MDSEVNSSEMQSVRTALRTLNHVSAMIAYWDCNQRCVFANDAYLEWFGRKPAEMKGILMKDLLGDIYPKNLPYILGVLKGEKQVFERQISLPNGELRESIATYTPDVVNGVVLGFSAHVADVTRMRDRERALQVALTEREKMQREIKTLSGLLPICASCKSIRDSEQKWHPLEKYVSEHCDASFTHGMCPVCLAKYYPGLLD